MPYWDWASDPTLPEIAYDKTISVIKSWNGLGEPRMEVLDNPMYRFQMPGHKPMGDPSYGNYRIVLPEEPDKSLVRIGHYSVSVAMTMLMKFSGRNALAPVAILSH